MRKPTANRSYYPDDVIARAVTLSTRGWSTGKISAEIGVPRGTVYDWVSAPERKALIESQRQSIASIAGDILTQRMEAAANGDQDISIRELTMVWGVAQDKVIQAARLNTPADHSTFYQLVAQQTVQTVILPPSPDSDSPSLPLNSSLPNPPSSGEL